MKYEMRYKCPECKVYLSHQIYWICPECGHTDKYHENIYLTAESGRWEDVDRKGWWHFWCKVKWVPKGK